MIDLRYVALTGIFIFLALAIGMMAGSALGGPDKRDAAYNALRQEFELLRSENQRVQDENNRVLRRMDAREQALEAMLPLAVQERLPGVSVGVILCGGIDESLFWGELEAALQTAGAEIGPVLRVPDELLPLDPARRQRLAQPWIGTSTLDARPFEAVGWMVRGMMAGMDSAVLNELAEATGMEFRAAEGPVRRLLLLTTGTVARGPALQDGRIPETEVVRAVQEQRARVVLAEPEAAEVSALESLRGRQVPTVDNIDTVPGQISAILALAGEDGHFGSKSGARPIPPLPQLQ